jgi:hypothetical protein
MDETAETVAAEPVPAPVPVLVLAGTQRSGSTLLDRLMSQAPGHVSAGEIVHLWTRGVRDDERCGCGLAFHACPFWSEVGRVACGGWDRRAVEDVVGLQRRVDRNRYIFFMLLPVLSRRYRRDLRAYGRILERLYRAISASGGGAVVVDSSTHASTAFLLRRVPGLRLRVVHLVRDGRGVAHSLGKRVRRPEVVEGEAFMHRQPAWRAGLEWLAFNVLFEGLRGAGTPVSRVRYEDLVAGPRRTLAPLTGGRVEDLAFIDGARVTLGIDHTVAGTPMRFVHGDVDLRVDDEWRSAMRPRDRRVVTAITAPLLRRYGYRLWRP